MEKWIEQITDLFTSYYESFKDLSEQDQKNFRIKKDHSIRVACYSLDLSDKIGMNDEEKKVAFFIGLFHDIGRFRQLKEYGTFDDSKSVDHAEYSVQVIKEEKLLKVLGENYEDQVLPAIQNHNKLKIDSQISGETLLFCKVIRDADKLDILKVLTDYYSSRNVFPNHTLTWDLPRGTSVSKEVSKEILAGKLVSKKNVASEMDVKVMQLSWVYDINFRPSFEYMLRERFLDSIYKSLSKSDHVIEIHRSVKMYVENQLMG